MKMPQTTPARGIVRGTTPAPRAFLPYERNHLLRHGIDPASIDPSDTRPVEYITGTVEFCSRVFSTDARALIPRVESERLVELAVQHNPRRIAEVGVGSGAVGAAVMLALLERIEQRDAQHGTQHTAPSSPQLTFFGSDTSQQALELAAGNMPTHPSLNTTLVQSDLFANYPEDSTFDCIIANLPYIPSARLGALDPSVRDHEPHLALDGGDDGLALIRRCIAGAPQHLSADGILILEVDDTHHQHPYWNTCSDWQLEWHADCFGVQRFVVLTLNMQY